METFSVNQVPPFVTENVRAIGLGLPTSQVRELATIGNTSYTLDETIIRADMVLIRWTNKICLYCGNHKDTARYHPCQACKLVFYCSEVCQHDDEPVHATECLKTNVRRESVREYLRFAVYNTATSMWTFI